MSFDAADTPMFRQYRELKAQYPDALLFFRMGDFYELFGPDAVWTAAALELTLTARNKDSPDPVPMCGVPHHAAEGYIRRVVEMGRKVAVADQVEDPRLAKGIVKREVVRVVTPGLSGETTDSHESAFLVAVGAPVAGGPFGLALLDASTGDLRVTEPRTLDEVVAELGRIEPREALLAAGTDDPAVRAALGTAPITLLPPFVADAAGIAARFGPDHGVGPAGLGAVGALLDYASAYLKSSLANVVTLKAYVLGGALGLDEATRRNLELFRPLRGAGRKGTLLGLLDTARTAMGGRLLREWLGAPLLDVAAITGRQAAVAAFVAEPNGRRAVIAALAEVADIERIAARVSLGNVTPRDLGALRTSLVRLPDIAATLATLDARAGAPERHAETGAPPESGSHAALASRLPADLAQDVAADLDRWLVDEPPPIQAEGGIVRPGVHDELDMLRGLSLDAKGAIAAMEGALRDETGVSSLKIRHNGVFGYYIEVTKANLHKVPPSWHRKQTIAGGERYITPALKEYEEQVSGADGRRIELEAELFAALRGRAAKEVARLQVVARGIAELDVLASFAELAVRSRWARPTVDTSTVIDIQAGRHPVVEATLPTSGEHGERFVPNDVRLDERGRLVLLTGPNMAGKSTLMRQIAQIVLLAQVGAFVPAASARIGICDRIFVRVGASDDVAHGQSTFMVEMSETANILVGGTHRSLVLLDEIGRGTSTYDGLAIAWAVAEDLHDRIQCRGVFATHYHELAALPETCPHVRNLHVAVTEHGDKIVFLRKLKEGAASGSYGIQCARLAGLPGPVVKRARALLQQLEKRRPKPEATQLSLFGGGRAEEPMALIELPVAPPAAPLSDPVREAVQRLDPDTMSPRDALVALYKLRDLLA